MRWIGRALVLGILCTAGTAVGYHPGCTGCSGGLSKPSWHHRGLEAEACAGPCGYSLAPGCCEDTRRCCSNAWAGYCEHRAKVDAFWYHVGVPGSCGRGKTSRPVIVSCQSCPAAAEEVPSAPAVPQPAPPAPARPVERDRMW